jgi:hypothetical protein
VREIILPVISQFEKRDNIYKAMFLSVTDGASIHVDEYYDHHPLNTYIFPLNVEPIDDSNPYETNTIVFHQSYYSDYRPTDERYDVSEFWKNAPVVNPNASNADEKYLGHAKRMVHQGVDLTKVSIEACFRWKMNCMLFFPRNRIHASDNLVKNNVALKQALTVFTTNDEIRYDMK